MELAVLRGEPPEVGQAEVGRHTCHGGVVGRGRHQPVVRLAQDPVPEEALRRFGASVLEGLPQSPRGR